MTTKELKREFFNQTGKDANHPVNYLDYINWLETKIVSSSSKSSNLCSIYIADGTIVGNCVNCGRAKWLHINK